MKATFEQLLNGEVNQISILNEPLNFVVDFTVPKAGNALSIARRRWRHAELIGGDCSERHEA
jgi:hypothetical protein